MQPLPGGRARGARDRPVGARRSRPTSRSRTSSPPPRRSPRSCAASRWRRWCRTCTRGRRPASRPTPSAPGCRARAPARGPGAASTRSSRAGLERGRREYNDCRARLGLGPLPGLHTGLSRALTLVATLPQLEYPRRWEPWLRVVGPAAVGAARRARSCRRRAAARSCSSRPSTAQDPGHAMLRAALAGLAGAPVRVIATYNGRAPEPAGRGPRQRGARPLALLRADDAGLRPRDHPRRPRHARARAVVRLPRRRVPGGRRHGRERRPRGLGGPGRPAAAAAALAAHACGSPSAARCATPACARGRAQVADWIARHDGAAAAVGELEAWVGGMGLAHAG